MRSRRRLERAPDAAVRRPIAGLSHERGAAARHQQRPRALGAWACRRHLHRARAGDEGSRAAIAGEPAAPPARCVATRTSMLAFARGMRNALGVHGSAPPRRCQSEACIARARALVALAHAALAPRAIRPPSLLEERVPAQSRDSTARRNQRRRSSPHTARRGSLIVTARQAANRDSSRRVAPFSPIRAHQAADPGPKRFLRRPRSSARRRYRAVALLRSESARPP